MKKKYFFDIILKREKLSNNSSIFVAHCASLGIASQGNDIDDALANIKEAIELYLEEQPEKYDELVSEETPLFSIVEVLKNDKAAGALRIRSS